MRAGFVLKNSGKSGVFWIAIFSIAVNVLMIVPPLHMLQVYDRVLASNSLETLIYITAIAVVGMVLYGVAEAVRGVLAQRAAARYTVAVSDTLFARLAAGTGQHDSTKYLRDFNNVRSFIASRTMVGLFDLPFAPFFVLLMFMLHWSLGVLTVIGMGALVAVAWINKAMTAKQSELSKTMDASALTFAQSVFSRSEDIRAMGLLPSIMERWGASMAQSLKAGDSSAGQASVFYGLSKAVRKILQIAIMAWGAYLVILGEISGGVIFAASMLSGRALAPFEQVIGGWDRIAQARRANDDLDALLATHNPDDNRIRLPEPRGQISVEGLTWNPHADGTGAPVLDGVTFDIPAGKVLAVIGPSGAGKSSVAKALVGALAIDSGQIKLDGAERSQWPEDQWGEAVGYVSQEIALFPASIAENIARLETRPDERRVVAAAQAAGVHELVTSMPDGYGTQIGPGKVMLSGGQKQRIALARALYTDPRVLVLDEPNAHLDGAGEESLMQAIKRAKASGRTIIIITQRRSVLQVADFIMTIINGKVDSFVNASFTRDNKQNPVREARARHEQAGRQQVSAPPMQAPGTSAPQTTAMHKATVQTATGQQGEPS